MGMEQQPWTPFEQKSEDRDGKKTEQAEVEPGYRDVVLIWHI